MLLDQHVSSQIVINELMQSNIDCVMDDQNEFPDSWVELYNNSGADVNLSNYKVGIESSPDVAWQLPDTIIKPKSYMLICCDKESKDFHTPFRLESGKGCNVYLFYGNDIIDQVVNLKKQPAPNIAYGRQFDGADVWGYQLDSSPLGPNTGRICEREHILGNPEFSIGGQVVQGNDKIELTVSVPDSSPDGTEIHYTTDGSEPTQESPTFKEPITLTETTVVRAKLFCEGWLSPRSTTHSYIFWQRDLTLPVVSLSIDNAFLEDSLIGIYVTGSYNKDKENFKYNWRRPANFEYFEGVNSGGLLNQLCETRIAGSGTRPRYDLRSMAIYANKRFGTKRFNHEFFPDDKPGLTDFKSLVLRNSGSDFESLYHRDALVQRLMGHNVDMDWQAYSPAVFFINGQYKGLINIRERANGNNIYTNYDGLEDIDLIEIWTNLKEGDMNALNEFTKFYSEQEHTLDEYEERMDVGEFINLMSIRLFFGDLDFPGNNIVMWRPRTQNGKWRWIAKDADFTLGLQGFKPNYKIFEWLYNENYDPRLQWGANKESKTLLFRRLMENDEFKKLFLERTCIYLGDFLAEDRIRCMWDSIYETIKVELGYHWAIYNPTLTAEEIQSKIEKELNTAHTWLSERYDEYYQQLSDFYNMEDAIPLTINGEADNSEGINLSMNGIQLKNSVFTGKFFPSIPLEITGKTSDGLTINRWMVKKETESGIEVYENWGGQISFEGCKSLSINAVSSLSAGIDEGDTQRRVSLINRELHISGTNRGDIIKVYNMMGMLLYSTVSDGTGFDIKLPNRHQSLIVKVNDESLKLYR